jgi:hypothetical protein
VNTIDPNSDEHKGLFRLLFKETSGSLARGPDGAKDMATAAMPTRRSEDSMKRMMLFSKRK